VDVRGAGPVAWRFLQRSLAQKYRFSSLGLAWAVLPAAMTALVLIGGQRMHTLATGDSGVPAAFYGIFGLIIAQPFLEAFQETRRLFVNNRHMLRRQKMPIEEVIFTALFTPSDSVGNIYVDPSLIVKNSMKKPEVTIQYFVDRGRRRTITFSLHRLNALLVGTLVFSLPHK
jgi:hypothetical protein